MTSLNKLLPRVKDARFRVRYIHPPTARGHSEPPRRLYPIYYTITQRLHVTSQAVRLSCRMFTNETRTRRFGTARSFPHSLFVLDHGGTELMYAVPNDCRSELLNAEDVRGRILLVNRGEVGKLNSRQKTYVRCAKESNAIDINPAVQQQLRHK